MAARPSGIEWIYLSRADEAHVKAGELISADAGGLPIYRVVEITAGRARLRDLRDGSDRTAPIQDFHWKARLDS